MVGIGVGYGFVCGTVYVQQLGGTALHQGLYGGVSLAAGGAAVAAVPPLAGSLGWEAPFLFAAIAGAATLPLVFLGREVRPPGGRREIPFFELLGDRRLIRFALIHSASFGLSIVLSNWVVNVLTEGGDYGEETAGLIGAAILVLGIFSRPGGGLLVHLRPARARALLAATVAAGATGSLLLGMAPALPLALLGSVLLGIASGAPFGALVDGIGRVFPDSPGAAFGAMNTYALVLIIVGTPLVGVTLSLPGDGLIGFAAAAGFCLLAGLFLPPQDLLEPPTHERAPTPTQPPPPTSAAEPRAPDGPNTADTERLYGTSARRGLRGGWGGGAEETRRLGRELADDLGGGADRRRSRRRPRRRSKPSPRPRPRRRRPARRRRSAGPRSARRRRSSSPPPRPPPPRRRRASRAGRGAGRRARAR